MHKNPSRCSTLTTAHEASIDLAPLPLDPVPARPAEVIWAARRAEVPPASQASPAAASFSPCKQASYHVCLSSASVFLFLRTYARMGGCNIHQSRQALGSIWARHLAPSEWVRPAQRQYSSYLRCLPCELRQLFSSRAAAFGKEVQVPLLSMAALKALHSKLQNFSTRNAAGTGHVCFTDARLAWLHNLVVDCRPTANLASSPSAPFIC